MYVLNRNMAFFCPAHQQPHRYLDPNDLTVPEAIFVLGENRYSPLYIILAQGIIRRMLALFLLCVSNRGAMGKPPLCIQKSVMAMFENMMSYMYSLLPSRDRSMSSENQHLHHKDSDVNQHLHHKVSDTSLELGGYLQKANAHFSQK
jgi:hypothetical protein